MAHDCEAAESRSQRAAAGMLPHAGLNRRPNTVAGASIREAPAAEMYAPVKSAVLPAALSLCGRLCPLLEASTAAVQACFGRCLTVGQWWAVKQRNPQRV